MSAGEPTLAQQRRRMRLARSIAVSGGLGLWLLIGRRVAKGFLEVFTHPGIGDYAVACIMGLVVPLVFSVVTGAVLWGIFILWRYAATGEWP